MQIAKTETGYTTADQQVFATLGEARGHSQRLAIAHYLLVLRHQLHEETGPIHRKLRESLLDLGDAIGDIFDESASLVYEGGRTRVQAPVFVSKIDREKCDGRTYTQNAVHPKRALAA